MSTIQIYPLVEDILKSLEPMARDYGVKVYTECKPLTIRANLQQMRELINNLMVNAIKYNKPEGSVHLSIISDQEDMILMVSDTGVGIPREAQRRVFERFYRLTGTQQKNGRDRTGSFHRQAYCQLLRRNIHLESQVDVGTTFTVRLPVIQEENKQGSLYRLP